MSYDLNPVKLDSNITFSIDKADELALIKEKHYYISNSNEALTMDEILQIDSWVLYEDVVQITEKASILFILRLLIMMIM